MIEIREFERSDIPEMVSIQEVIVKNKVSQSWTRMVERHMNDSNDLGYVALLDGKVVGFAIGQIKGEGFGLRQSGWIEVLGVAPNEMGEGIGKAMIKALLDSFQERGVTDVYTSVRWDSVDMVSFFKSVGFGRSDFINLTRKL